MFVAGLGFEPRIFWVKARCPTVRRSRNVYSSIDSSRANSNGNC